MNSIIRTYYRLTAFIPRPLPRTENEFLDLKAKLIHYFDVQDRPDIWMTVCGQMTSLAPVKTRISYQRLVNVAKRLDINGVVHNQKVLENGKLMARLKELTDKMADEEKNNSAMPDGSPDIQGAVHLVPEPESRLVSNSEPSGI